MIHILIIENQNVDATRGIGERLLLRMGYEPGKGLGMLTVKSYHKLTLIPYFCVMIHPNQEKTSKVLRVHFKHIDGWVEPELVHTKLAMAMAMNN